MKILRLIKKIKEKNEDTYLSRVRVPERNLISRTGLNNVKAN